MSAQIDSTKQEDADDVLARLFQLAPEEQTRFTLLLVSGFDADTMNILRKYHRTLEDAGVSPEDKAAFYTALDLKTAEKAQDQSAEDFFDFNLLDDNGPSDLTRLRLRLG